MSSLDWKFSWNIFKTEGYTNPKLLCRQTSMDNGTLRTDQAVTKHEWKYLPKWKKEGSFIKIICFIHLKKLVYCVGCSKNSSNCER